MLRIHSRILFRKNYLSPFSITPLSTHERSRNVHDVFSFSFSFSFSFYSSCRILWKEGHCIDRTIFNSFFFPMICLCQFFYVENKFYNSFFYGANCKTFELSLSKTMFVLRILHYNKSPTPSFILYFPK